MKLPRLKVIIGTILILSIIVSLIAHFLSRRLQVIDSEVSFNYDARLFEQNIISKVERYESLLTSLDSFVAHSEIVTRQEWEDYVNYIDIQNSYPGILSASYITPVTRENFNIFEQTLPQGSKIRPLVQGEEHQDVGFIVTYISPTSETLKSFVGFDLFTNEPRRDSIIRALESRKSAATQSIIFVDGTKGFNLVSPVFSKDTKDIRAIVMTSINQNTLFDELIKNLEIPGDYNVEIKDIASNSIAFEKATENYSIGDLNYVFTLSIGDKILDFKINANENGYVTGVNVIRPYAVGVIVFSLFFVINLSIALMYRSSRTAITNIQTVSQDLVQSRSILKSLIDNYSAVVYVKDLSNKLIMVNKKYEELSKTDRHDLIGKDERKYYPFTNYEKSLELDEQLKKDSIQKELVENNDTRIYKTVKFILADPKGTVYAICGISVDITDAQNFQHELEERNEQLEKLTKLMVGRELRMAELKKMVDEKEEERDQQSVVSNQQSV